MRTSTFKWWLEQRFPSLGFDYFRSGEADATERIAQSIDNRILVMVSVSHERVAGHIILVIGYENRWLSMSSDDFRLVAHDPYGRFDLSLASLLYGKRRDRGAASLAIGGESGPGASVRLPISAVGRRREYAGSVGQYILLMPRRS